jgi:hypothetical protein
VRVRHVHDAHSGWEEAAFCAGTGDRRHAQCVLHHDAVVFCAPWTARTGEAETEERVVAREAGRERQGERGREKGREREGEGKFIEAGANRLRGLTWPRLRPRAP